MYGHAIELALKSILVKNGIAEEKLLKIGHDLAMTLEKADSCPEKEFFDPALREIIAILNPEYGKKHLEYRPGPRGMHLPAEGEMQETVKSLIKNLEARYRKQRSGAGRV